MKNSTARNKTEFEALLDGVVETTGKAGVPLAVACGFMSLATEQIYEIKNAGMISEDDIPDLIQLITSIENGLADCKHSLLATDEIDQEPDSFEKFEETQEVDAKLKAVREMVAVSVNLIRSRTIDKSHDESLGNVIFWLSRRAHEIKRLIM